MSDAYVLALVGGTGVGKSTLLNAIAGRTVSEAGARRPTTGQPVAWVSATAAPRVAPLLDRLGAGERRLHDDPALEGVVILDLPDVDSVEPAHRATVEEVLLRVDAVAWVTDPEKYADALLDDGFLRRWIPRLDRQVVVLNKGDRLAPEAADRVHGHLGRVLATSWPGRPRPARRCSWCRRWAALTASRRSGRGSTTGSMPSRWSPGASRQRP